MTEKQVRKRIRSNAKAQIDDIVRFCKVSIDVFKTIAVAELQVARDAKIEAFQAVLKRLGKDGDE